MAGERSMIVKDIIGRNFSFYGSNAQGQFYIDVDGNVYRLDARRKIMFMGMVDRKIPFMTALARNLLKEGFPVHDWSPSIFTNYGGR